MIKNPCKACKGRGYIRVQKKLNVRIPAGVNTGARLRMRGEGMKMPGDTIAGDLYIVLNVKEHSVFEREGDNIIVQVDVNYPLLSLGGTITVPTGVTTIGANAFYGCAGLTGVIIPASVTSIGDYAFYGCTSLTGVCCMGNAPNLTGTNVFSGDNNATVYYMPGTTGWGGTFGGRPTVGPEGVAYADSTDFTLNTGGTVAGMAGVAYSDSTDFTLNTGGALAGIGGVAYADSVDFTLNTGRALSGLAGVAYADSTDFTLNTLNSVVSGLPQLTSISIAGTTLTIQAVNGTVSGQYVLLGSTNAALPLSQWTPLLTNNFSSGGILNLSTNIINPAVPQQFYMLEQ